MGRKKFIEDLKEYQKIYQKKYREKHREEINRRARDKANLFNQVLKEFKKDKSCSSCGYKEHPEILEFHHLRDKVSDISSLRGKVSMKKADIEMNKCILICPNCHRWLHWNEIINSKEKFKKKDI